jgi:hypothetical protein
MNLRLLYHGHCFDGVASAATFTRFYKEKVHPQADVEYAGLLHRPGNLFDEGMFDGDENAIVDFKYSASPLLTWWFDHHPRGRSALSLGGFGEEVSRYDQQVMY